MITGVDSGERGNSFKPPLEKPLLAECTRVTTSLTCEAKQGCEALRAGTLKFRDRGPWKILTFQNQEIETALKVGVVLSTNA